MPPRVELKDFTKAFRQRTWVRLYSPWFLIDKGWMSKGRDCEAKGAQHEWYNVDNLNSGCYHCTIIRPGKLWKLNQ